MLQFTEKNYCFKVYRIYWYVGIIILYPLFKNTYFKKYRFSSIWFQPQFEIAGSWRFNSGHFVAQKRDGEKRVGYCSLFFYNSSYITFVMAPQSKNPSNILSSIFSLHRFFPENGGWSVSTRGKQFPSAYGQCTIAAELQTPSDR